MKIPVFETTIAVTITNDLVNKAGGNVRTSPGLPYDYSVVIDGPDAMALRPSLCVFYFILYFDEETSNAACDLL